MARALHEKDKLVFSSTLISTSWHRSNIVHSLDNDYVSSFKNNTNGSLLTFGSLGVIESLTALNAVDEYYFNIQPLIAGKGEDRFFKKWLLNMPQRLQYVDAIHLSSGAHIIHYKNGSVRDKV